MDDHACGKYLQKNNNPADIFMMEAVPTVLLFPYLFGPEKGEEVFLCSRPNPLH